MQLNGRYFSTCTVYVIDEKGLDNLRRDFSEKYDIHTVLIKRDKVPYAENPALMKLAFVGMNAETLKMRITIM